MFKQKHCFLEPKTTKRVETTICFLEPKTIKHITKNIVFLSKKTVLVKQTILHVHDVLIHFPIIVSGIGRHCFFLGPDLLPLIVSQNF